MTVARPAPPHAVLFDIGMTLIHPSGRVMLDELNRLGAAEGLQAQDAAAALAAAAEVHHLDFPRGLTRTEKVGVVWGALLGVSPDTGMRAWTACAERPDLYCDLDPDAVLVLQTLRSQGLRTAAVSNSDGTLPAELTAFGLSNLFDVVADSTAVGCEKPQPQIFQTALAELGTAPEDAWFVGDGLLNDVFGAHTAGISTAVLYDRHRVHRPLPVLTITALVGLLDLLPGGGAGLVPSGAPASGGLLWLRDA
ncbi:MAG: HAD-IA family hydrolase [Pseudonocardiaceae bacterium]